MGQTLSTGKLTEPVTLPRIWSACQVKASMPPELQNFNIKLLVDDMNKLGANIPTDESNDKTCKMIYDFLPSAEQVCFVGKNADPHAVYRAAHQFNKNFGTAIPVFRNGMNDKEGYRPVADICDDLYMTQQRVYRSLNENTTVVKKKLYDSIVQLRAQQQALDAEFANFKGALTRGPQLDAIMTAQKQDLEKQKEVLNHFQAQQHVLKDQYKTLHSNLKTVAPLMAGPIGVAPISMSSVMAMSGGGNRDSVDEGRLTGLIGGAVNLGIVAQKLGDCFTHMNTAYDEYVRESAKPIESLKSWVASKQHDALLDDQVNNYGANTPVINACAAALVSQAGYVTNMELVKNSVSKMHANSCKINEIFTNPADREFACKSNSLCAWLNGTCVENRYDKGITGPQATKARYVNYDNYTISAFSSLRNTIAKIAMGSDDPHVIANQVEHTFVDKLFTEVFTRKAQSYPSIAKFLETRPSDGEGIMANKYLSSFYGNMLASFANYLIRKYSLNVKNVANQNTLLAEAYAAYYDADSQDPLIKNRTSNVERVLKPDMLTKLFYDYENSTEAHALFNLHDNHLKKYIF